MAVVPLGTGQGFVDHGEAGFCGVKLLPEESSVSRRYQRRAEWAVFSDRETLWVIHIGNSDTIALRARDEGFVCIGWSKLGDLSGLSTREEVRDAMSLAWPDWKPGRIRSSYGQVYRFVHVMKVGDPIVFPIRPTREIAIGRVAGDYEFVSDDDALGKADYSNRRRVEWLKMIPRTVFSNSALHSFGSFMTLSTSDDYLEEVMAVLEGATPSAVTAEPPLSAGAEQRDDEEQAEASLFELAVQETEDYLLKSWIRTSYDFEEVVAAVLEATGLTTTVTRRSGDGGVDVIAQRDPLGLEPPLLKVQVKSGTSKVGEPEVSQLLGTLGEGEKGLIVSLGGFAGPAAAKARNTPRVTLLDAKEFVGLFLQYYEALDPTWKAKFPLSRVYVPRR